MQGMPGLGGVQGPLRRHGDEVERLPGGFYVAHGRCDDTMNLGGIKVCLPAHAQCCLHGALHTALMVRPAYSCFVE